MMAFPLLKCSLATRFRLLRTASWWMTRAPPGNSIDEVIVGCTKITVTLNLDNSLTILDNGRGIPTEIHPKKQIPTLEVIFSSLHSGGKFDKKSYAVSGGLHGVGLAVVNACSEWAWIKVWRDGKRHELKVGQRSNFRSHQRIPGY